MPWLRNRLRQNLRTKRKLALRGCGSIYLALVVRNSVEFDFSRVACLVERELSALRQRRTGPPEVKGHGIAVSVSALHVDSVGRQLSSQASALQLVHSALAIARYDMPGRLARWLLMCHDRLRDNTLRLTAVFTMKTVSPPPPIVESLTFYRCGYRP